MAKRVNADEVKAIIDTTLTSTVINSYITSANVYVDEVLTGKGLSDAILKEIERWLSAHMIASTKERQSKEEGAGGAFIKYTGYWSTGLLGTSYGQMAVSLDSSGTLDALTKGKGTVSTQAIPQFD